MKISISVLAFSFAVSMAAFASCNQIFKQDTAKPVVDSASIKKAGEFVFKDNAYNQAARYIAGMPQLDSNAYSMATKKPIWQKYARQVDSTWALYDKNRLSIMRNWYETEFGAYRHQEKNVFYPFSGPDWLNIYTIYPNGNKYVMAGLELVGNNPEPNKLSDAELAKGLDGLRGGLKTLIERGYFITSYMGRDLYASKFNGVLPVIYFFMARTNCNIVDQKFIGLDAEGNEHEINTAMKTDANANYMRGVKILFQHPDTKKLGIVYYFSGDVEDKAIAAGKTNFPNFVKKNWHNTNTFIKAASYLMHTPTFVTLKNLVLDKSDVILTDDSGLPLKAVNDGKWDLTYYGHYNGPTSDFPYIKEYDRLAIYKKDSAKIKPIPFGTGYNGD